MYAMDRREKKKVRKFAKRAVTSATRKPSVSQRMRFGLAPPRGRARRVAPSGFKNGLVAPTSQRLNSHVKESAPYHPTFGVGDRHTFYYMGREVARSGATENQTVGGAALPPNNEYSVMRVPKDGATYTPVTVPMLTSQSTSSVTSAVAQPNTASTAYRYDSGAIFLPFMLPSASTTGCSYESAFATSISSGSNYNAYNPIFDTLKYYDQVAVRAIEVDYDPSVAYTATGNLVISAETDYTSLYTAANAKGYDKQSSNRVRVKTKLSEKAHLDVLKPSAAQMAQPAPSTIDIMSYAWDNSEPAWVIRAAVDTTLSVAAVDRVGSMSFKVVMDCYAYHWNPDLQAMAYGLESPDDQFKRRYAKLLGFDGLKPVAMGDVRPLRALSPRRLAPRLTTVDEDYVQLADAGGLELKECKLAKQEDKDNRVEVKPKTKN